jgi:prophage regulatory protein
MSTETQVQSPLLTVKELAEMLGVTIICVYRWRDAGEIPPSIKIGGSVRWRRSDIDAWLASK